MTTPRLVKIPVSINGRWIYIFPESRTAGTIPWLIGIDPGRVNVAIVKGRRQRKWLLPETVIRLSAGMRFETRLRAELDRAPKRKIKTTTLKR